MTKSEFKIELIKLSLCSGLVIVNIINTIQDFTWVNLTLAMIWCMFYIVDFKNILKNF